MDTHVGDYIYQILNCINCGNLSGTSNVGGIVGYAFARAYNSSYYTQISLQNCCNYSIKGLIGTYSTSYGGRVYYDECYFLYDIVNNIGQENPVCSKSGSGNYFTRTSSGCYLTGNTSNDIVTLLNKWVSEQSDPSQYYRWKYEVIDGYARPVFDK